MSQAASGETENEPANTDSTIGAITAIDGDTPSKANREKWANSLRDKLANLDGVTGVRAVPMDSYGNTYVLYVTVQSVERWGQYDLKINTRSMGQRIRSVLDDDVPANANIFDTEFESPDSLGNGKHDSDQYRVAVTYP